MPPRKPRRKTASSYVRKPQIQKQCIVCGQRFESAREIMIYHDGHNGVCWLTLMNAHRNQDVLQLFQAAIVKQGALCWSCKEPRILHPIIMVPEKAMIPDEITANDVAASCGNCRTTYYQKLARVDTTTST